jgi:carbon monoxide dehydrogenase subunit G
MELTHEFTVPAPPEVTWQTFMDLERVGGCFPGATVTEVSDEGFKGTVKVKLGPIALQYTGSGSFVERDDAARRAVIEAKGKDKRGNGTAGATVTIGLAEDGDGTRVEVATELSVTGKPAQFGRGVMQDVSDKLLQQFIACIEGELTGPAESAAEPSAEEPTAMPGPTPAPEAAAAAPAAPTPAPEPRPAPSRPPAAADDSIDLGATVLPVVLRSYGPYLAAGLVGLLLGWLLGRRRG